MPSTCEETVATSIQSVSSTSDTVVLPELTMSSVGLYPVLVGWLALIIITVFVVFFLIGYIFSISVITEHLSKFVWGSLLVLTVSLLAINGSFSAAAKKNICNAAKSPSIKVILGTLAAITILMGYIINFEFGKSIDPGQTYIIVMLHVNLFCSMLVLSYVTLFQISKASI